MEGGAINQRPYEQQLKYSNMNERWTSSLLYHLRCGSPRSDRKRTSYRWTFHILLGVESGVHKVDSPVSKVSLNALDGWPYLGETTMVPDHRTHSV